MLELLRIKNFVVIENQEIEFGEGLNVITGETGSGKSVLLQALSLILGGRPKAKYTRKGADIWEIEAAFSLSFLTTEDYESLPEIAKNDEKQLILYRSGGETKSKILVNGHLATVSLLQDVTQRIINICGQGEFVTLLDARSHLKLVDQYAGNGKLLEKVYADYALWHAADTDLRNLARLREQSITKRIELENIVEDLSKVEWRAGIRSELDAKLNRLNSSEVLIKSIGSLLDNIASAGGISENIASLQSELNLLIRKDKTLEAGLEKIFTIKADLEDFVDYLEKYLSSLDLDESELNDLREQLANVAALERKYRLPDDALSRLLEKSRAELATLDNLPDQEEAERKCKLALEKLLENSELLHQSRKRASDQLCKAITSELKELSMPDTKVQVELTRIEPTATGFDRAEFLASTNRGQDVQPIRLIASGGELARILLVMKKLLRDKTGVNVLVFDEVDSGVSGKVARCVGEKLKELAKNSQVLCITHLAQVASLADHHLAVRKLTKEGFTVVSNLSAEAERIDEIAKLLAGHEVTKAVRESARELLKN